MPDSSDLKISLIRNSSCTVHAIPPELLWKIFMINTEVQIENDHQWFGVEGDDDLEDHRLDTARNCSQVCQLWRTLLLRLPSVWGRLLHIGSFERTADAWREAVVSRTGNASLWIIGTISDSTRPFIFSILRQKWQNVQYLVVKDEDMYGREILPTWSFLEREAPKLEVLKLLVNKYDEGRDTRYILPFSPFFNNSAPRLKEFRTLQPFRLIVPSPWMFNLHTVTFSRQENTSLILSALKSMPLLRTLIISGNPSRCAVHAEDSDLDKPLLPMLETLWIRDCDAIQLMLLLESITLSPGQRILRTLQIPAAIPPPRLVRLQERASRAVVKWVHDYIEAFPPHYFALGDLDLLLFLTDSQSSEKGFRLDLLFDSQSHHTIKNIADSSHFSDVERLHIFLDASTRWPLLPLYKALRSITYLISCGPGLGTLFQDMLQFSLFPDLHTIDLSGPDQDITIDDRRGDESVIPRIIDFLEHRESIESPISVLDLSSLRADGVSDINKERLGKISGLSVKFPQGV